jgi:hypothetical protein
MNCEPGCTCCTPAPTNALFLVTINPEGRVNADRTDVGVDALHPREWATIPVAIVNEGYVTGPLQIRSSSIPGVEIDAPETELTGAATQDIQFRIRFTEPGAADLTLRFWALGALGGLANKNTAFLYVRCREEDIHIPAAPKPDSKQVAR